MQALTTALMRFRRRRAATSSARRRVAALITAASLLLVAAALAGAPPSSGKPKPPPPTTTPTPTPTPTATATPTGTPTTETCWAPASEPVGPETTWSASETTGSCNYRFDYLSSLGWVMFSTDAWIWIYEPADDAGDPIAFSFADEQWTLYISEPNGTACGQGGACGSQEPLVDAEPDPTVTP
jgi:hypothetical protein